MPKIKLSSLKELSILIPKEGGGDSDGSYSRDDFRIPEIPGVKDDTGMVDQRIFITDFSEQDVEEFRRHLRLNPPMKHQNDLEEQLSWCLRSWCEKHSGQCPYEPFLWALKSTGGYIGSKSSIAMPQPWLLNAVGMALLSVWNGPSRLNVLKNVILKWDWYQPVHVMINLYEHLYEINDDEIDECLRKKWLYSALFYDTAFWCLSRKKKSQKNIQTLMRFISQDTQLDRLKTSIQITKRMRSEIYNYLYNASDDDFELAKTYYQDELYDCSKRARRIFDELFAKNNSSADVADFISRWRQSRSEESKNGLRWELKRLFDKEAFSKHLIADAASAGSHDLLVEITRLAEERITTFKAQYLIQNMLESKCPEYDQFIFEGYQKYGKNAADDKSFLYACAYCQLGHPEILGELFRSFFMNGVGGKQGKFLFLRIRTVYPKQYGSEVDRLVKLCLENDKNAYTLIYNCSKIFQQKDSLAFPTAFTQVCEKLIEAVKRQDRKAVQYAAALMDLYERIANIQNREKYYKALIDIHYNTNTPALKNAHGRSGKLISNIYAQ